MARQTPPDANPAEQHNIIGKETVIDGTVRSSGNVHISGTVKGNVDVQGRTVVMPGGTVEGEVVSTSAEIGGRVKGQVSVKERLVLKATAEVDGDLRTSKLVIEDGASFSGSCDMSGGAAPRKAPSPPSSSGDESENQESIRLTRRLGSSSDASEAAGRS
ncbi:MAG: polymer-forming cytoskeletal protein [Rubricoccaceae bacterium]|nr:polymer-forming cytoskeletal protein [Rubricoccaceae bacterium]